MSETLRPSTLGEILDRTAQLYRRNFWMFAGVAALPVGAMFAIGAIAVAVITAVGVAVRTTNSSSPVAIGFVALAVVLVGMPLYVAAAVFSYAGLTEAAEKVHRGEKMTIRGVLKSVRPWFWRYLWFLILQGIVTALVPGAIAGAVIGLLLFLIPGAGAAAGVAIGFVIFVIAVGALGVIVWRVLGYSIGLPVCVVEKKPAWESLKRAWELSKGTRGRIFVMILLIVALSIAASLIAAIPFLIIVAVNTSVGNGAAYSSTAFVIAEIVRVVGDFILQVLIAPISAIALVLFYYDQRIRKEGFDIEWMMQQAGLTEPSSNALPAEGASISGPVAPPDTVEEP
ncbi:MAG: hypothetical protein ABSD61_04680 [Terracidiphilus sp.]|jgi:hypothetical protein